jgi:RNA polymerase sigma-70 factor (ECF subfamily)
MSTQGGDSASEGSFGDDTELARLLAAAKTGSAAAVEDLFRKLYPYLLLCAREELDSDLRPHVRESDLVQQSCMEAHRDFNRLNASTVDGLFDWLTAILRANAADLRRRFNARKRHGTEPEFSLDDSGSSQATTAKETLLDQTAADDTTGSTQTADAELDRALALLPEEYRHVILLRHRDKLSFADIGARTSRTPDAARMFWKRAIKRLQDELGRNKP